MALTTFGNLPAAEVAEKQEYALAAAARPALGQAGFTIMAVAALFSTASAINATLFGGANVSVQIAHDRQMPALFARTGWDGASYGLYITAGLVAVLAALVPLDAIANTGSAAFLVIYGFVCVSHLKLRQSTNGAAWLIWPGILGCAGMLGLLLTHLSRKDVPSLIGFCALIALSIAIEFAYKRFANARG